MNRNGRDKIMDVPVRVKLLEDELTEHEESVAEQISALRQENKDAQKEAKEQSKATNRLLFAIFMALLTFLGGVITLLAQA